MTGARVLRRGVVSLAAALAVAFAILDGLTPVAAAVVPQDTLAHAKSLYAAASYDEALAVLDKLNPAADDATSVAGGRGNGTRRRIARVTMPSVPSDPTKSFSSERPATSLIRLPPRVMSVPSARTTSRPRT